MLLSDTTFRTPKSSKIIQTFSVYAMPIATEGTFLFPIGEEKTRAKSVCEEFAKAIKGVQHKLEEHERRSISQILAYDTKV